METQLVMDRPVMQVRAEVDPIVPTWYKSSTKTRRTQHPWTKNLVTDFFQNSKVYRTYTGELVNSGQGNTAKDAQVYFASAGYFNTVSQIANDNALQNNQDNVGGNARLQVLLNNSPASMRGMTVCPEVPGEYEFTCTRNNNFSNRDQKLTIKVNPAGTQA